MNGVASRFTRAWVDAFGSAYAILEGGTGNHVALIVAPLELASGALEELSKINGFKGRVVLCALEVVRQAPMLAALRETEPQFVIALEEMTGIASSGAECKIESGEFTASTGLTYLETGEVPAWRSNLRLETALEHPSLVASLGVRQGISALACGTSSLLEALAVVLS
jgi:hypothetical protein